MSNSFFSPFKTLIYFIIFILLFISVFFIPIFPDSFYSYSYSNSNNLEIDISASGYAWPSPGYTKINSYFGYRTSPTAGASSYHSGLDIGAPEGSKLIAVTSGKITFTSFLGGGGYTITLTSGNMKFTYCHVSPNYIVKVRRRSNTRSSNWSCRSQICLWSKRKPVCRCQWNSYQWRYYWSSSSFWCSCKWKLYRSFNLI